MITFVAKRPIGKTRKQHVDQETAAILAGTADERSFGRRSRESVRNPGFGAEPPSTWALEGFTDSLGEAETWLGHTLRCA